MAHYRSGIIVAIAALVIAVGTPAFSAKPAPKPIIQSVIVQTNTLQINGANFGAEPMVTLAGTTLTATPNDIGTQIVASIPSGTLAGTYKLSVVVASQSAEFYVTIGAAGSFGVYDGTGLFLGVLINADKGGYKVFNPDIPAFLYLTTKQNPPRFEVPPLPSPPSSGLPCYYDRFAFTTSDCTGQLYVLTTGFSDGGEGCGLQDLIYNFHSGQNYILDTSLPILKWSDLQSIHALTWQECNTNMASFAKSDETAFPVKEIPIPELLTTPLQYPITIQPIQ